MARDPFAIPAVSASRTKIIDQAYAMVQAQQASQRDPRDILKGLASEHGAKITYPSYRTALRIGDIYTEAAAACSMREAEIVLSSFTNKARAYLQQAGAAPTML